MTLPIRSRRWPLAVLAASLAAGLSPTAQAADATPEFSVLARFTGSDGALPGIRPFAAPIWSAKDGKLLGTTRSGAADYTIEAYPGVMISYTQGVVYRYAQDGTFSSSPLGDDIGWGSTPLVQRSDGDIVGGAMYGKPASGTDTAGSLFALRDGQPVRLGDGPKARGQLGVSPAGTLYTANGLGTSCSNGAGAALHQIAQDGTVSVTADFCGFATTDARRRVIFSKGASPVINVWSTADNALYGMSFISSNAVHDGVPDGDNAGGALVRIDGDALQAGSLSADDIDVLRVFARNAEGAVTAGDIFAVGMVEDGEWLYGTLTGGNDALGAVWRIRKSDPASFQLVQRFDVDLTAAASDADGTPTNPAGQLVRGADGNIYGTTRRDASSIQSTGASGKFSAVGAGTIWRIKVGSQVDRSDDTFEVLHRFDTTDGAMPVGLAAGPVVDGKQLIFGATEYGGVAGDTCYTAEGAVVSTDCTGNGTLFQLAIPLPPVTVEHFTADGSTSLATSNGARPTLSWQSSGAASCEASDNWSGARQTSGSEQIGPLAAGDYRYTLACTSDQGVQSLPASITVKVTEPSSGGDGNGGNDGGGNTGGDSNSSGGGGGGGPLTPVTLLLAGLALAGRLVRRSAR